MTRLVLSVALLFLTAMMSAQTEPCSAEMARLVRALVGDWNNTASMVASEVFPNAGERRGVLRWRLAVGGTTLVGEGNSDGSSGAVELHAHNLVGQASRYLLLLHLLQRHWQFVQSTGYCSLGW